MITSISDKATAIRSLVPEAEVSIFKDVVTWHKPNKAPVTDKEIQVEMDRLQAEYDAQAYARKRAVAYPSIQECVHAILDDTLDALQAKRAEIKTKYPKGG